MSNEKSAIVQVLEWLFGDTRQENITELTEGLNKKYGDGFVKTNDLQNAKGVESVLDKMVGEKRTQHSLDVRLNRAQRIQESGIAYLTGGWLSGGTTGFVRKKFDENKALVNSNTELTTIKEAQKTSAQKKKAEAEKRKTANSGLSAEKDLGKFSNSFVSRLSTDESLKSYISVGTGVINIKEALETAGSSGANLEKMGTGERFELISNIEKALKETAKNMPQDAGIKLSQEDINNAARKVMEEKQASAKKAEEQKTKSAENEKTNKINTTQRSLESKTLTEPRETSAAVTNRVNAEFDGAINKEGQFEIIKIFSSIKEAVKPLDAKSFTDKLLLFIETQDQKNPLDLQGFKDFLNTHKESVINPEQRNATQVQSAAAPTGPSVQPTSQPSVQPTSQPSVQPTSQPSVQPTSQPSVQPTSQPSVQTTAQPSVQPTAANNNTRTDASGSTNKASQIGLKSSASSLVATDAPSINPLAGLKQKMH